MKLLIKNARVTDPASPHNGQTADIFIENGTISRIGNNLPVQADKTIDIPGLYVSPGWVDVFANFADPGYEYKETLESGRRRWLYRCDGNTQHQTGAAKQGSGGVCYP